MNIFEQATKNKLRFSTSKGNITTEDLWSLPLTQLDKLAQKLQKEVEATKGTKSFITPTPVSTGIRTDQLRFDVCLHIINVKLAERDAAKLRTEKAAQKARIMEIIAQKQDESLVGKSMEDLQKMLEQL